MAFVPIGLSILGGMALAGGGGGSAPGRAHFVPIDDDLEPDLTGRERVDHEGQDAPPYPAP